MPAQVRGKLGGGVGGVGWKGEACWKRGLGLAGVGWDGGVGPGEVAWCAAGRVGMMYSAFCVLLCWCSQMACVAENCRVVVGLPSNALVLRTLRKQY